MSHTGRNSLIYQISELYGRKTKEKERMVFSADTNSLLSADSARVISATTETVGDDRLEYVYETSDYEKLMRGQIHFIVIKNENVKLYDDIIIYETKNFIRTGKYEIKRITQIERSKDSPGIKDGYCVIGWE